MYSRKKKPCSICRRWFEPDARVGRRQRVCSSPECQRKRRRQKQAAWRRSRPDYFTARRILKRAEADRPPEPLRVKRPVNALPWDIAQDEMGVAAADFLAILVGLLLRLIQSQSERQALDTS
jgi:hypothetical protein